MSRDSVRERPKTISWRRLMGRASLATHLQRSQYPEKAEGMILLGVLGIYSSNIEAGRQGALLDFRVCWCGRRRGETSARPAARDVTARGSIKVHRVPLLRSAMESMLTVPCACRQRLHES